MQCIKSSLTSMTATATEPITLAFDHLISMATTGSMSQDFTTSELHFILIGIIATILVGLGSMIAIVLLNLIASTIRFIKHFLTRTTPTTNSIHSIHLIKHTTSFNELDTDNESVSTSATHSSVGEKDTATPTIVNNYTTHIHGPIINVGAEAVGSLRRMLELGSTSGRMLGIDEEDECEEDECEEDDVEEDDGVAAVEN